MVKLVDAGEIFKAVYPSIHDGLRRFWWWDGGFDVEQRRPLRPAGAPFKGDHQPHTIEDLIALAKQRDDCASEAEHIMKRWASAFGLTDEEAVDLLWQDPEWCEWYPPEECRMDGNE